MDLTSKTDNLIPLSVCIIANPFFDFHGCCLTERHMVWHVSPLLLPNILIPFKCKLIDSGNEFNKNHCSQSNSRSCHHGRPFCDLHNRIDFFKDYETGVDRSPLWPIALSNGMFLMERSTEIVKSIKTNKFSCDWGNVTCMTRYRKMLMVIKRHSKEQINCESEFDEAETARP